MPKTRGGRWLKRRRGGGEEGPGNAGRRSLSRSSTEVRGRVFIMYSGESVENSWEYIIIVYDLEREDIVFRIRIDKNCFPRATFCMVGTTLFAFEGFQIMFPHDKNLTVLKYEIPTNCSETDIKMERSMFVKAGELKDSKFAPKALVLPNGKILVFSTTIKYDPIWARRGDFEIFDPVEGVSHELPNLYPSTSLVWAVERRNSFYVSSHSIMENILLLKTNIGFFTLNIKPPYMTKQWRYDGLSGPFPGGQNLPTHPSNSFVVIGNKICLLSYYAYDLVQSDRRRGRKVDPFSRWYYKIPDLSVIPDEGFVYGGMTVLEEKDDIGLGYLKAGINSDNHLRMRFDVYQMDVKECMKELASIRKKKMKKGMERELIVLPGITKVKSLEFIDKAAKFESSFAFLHYSRI